MIEEQATRVSLELLEAFMTDVFKGIGVPDADAVICANVLATADLRGIDSHGVARLKSIYYDRIVKDKVQQPATRLEVLRDRQAAAVVDGHHGMGMVIAHRCMQMAMDKARTHGVGAVAARHSTHFGIAAYYPLMACREGMIGFTTTNARPSIAPTFGVENMLGTNPLVFAMPTDEPFEFTNDYATSVSQRGKVEEYARAGKPLPAGWVIGHDGQYQTDAAAVLRDLIAGQSALAPLGGLGEETAGYKGYGFATVAELLCAALQQGSFLHQLSGIGEDGRKVPHNLGHFFMALNIEFFTDLPAFKKTTGDILRALRASRKAPGASRIYTCGEKEYLAALERREKGVPIGRATQEELKAMRDELRLFRYRFPFE